jgi:hypothetical protein
VKIHHTRKAMHLAWPMLKLLGMSAVGIVVAALLGLTYLGVW